MKHTEIQYKIKGSDGIFTKVVNEEKGLEKYYEKDVLSTIEGIVDARDQNGEQIAVVVGLIRHEYV